MRLLKYPVVDLHNEPSHDLLIGRRMLEDIPQIRIIEDLHWEPSSNVWVLVCEIIIKPPLVQHITPVTRWFIHLEPTYPRGAIMFYPSKEKGISVTFPHQAYNGQASVSTPWNLGYLCLDSNVKLLGWAASDVEPSDPIGRLAWYARRAIVWLTQAADNELLKAGDPYEIPPIPVESNQLCVFHEDQKTYSKWEEINEDSGLAKLITLGSNIRVVKSYSTPNGTKIIDNAWGALLEQLYTSSKVELGIWVRLRSVPVVEAWHIPREWADLVEVCLNQGTELYSHLRRLSHRLRDGKPHLLLLGFPIPELVGSAPIQYQWLALQLPVLSFGHKTAKGFRENEKGYWQRDIRLVYPSYRNVRWIRSENWSQDQLLSRGRLNPSVTYANTFQIGAGALGSVIAELLVRGGIKRLTIADGDMLHAGNLVRHALSLDYLLSNKALSLASALNMCSPGATVRGVPEYFTGDVLDGMKEAKVLIDCSADDAVIKSLATIKWTNFKKFVSCSLGFGSKRLFLFTCGGMQFPADVFYQLLSPWISREAQEYSYEDLPREGIGCWNPVFPARADDIWLLSSVAVKQIEVFLSGTDNVPQLYVYEQQWQDGVFQGMTLLERNVVDDY